MLDQDALNDLDITSLVPHQGSMCLWHRVVSADADAVTVSTHSHRDPANPLCSFDRLSAVHLCEYGAQAMAVHGGLLARTTAASVRTGYLVALRGVELHVSRIDNLSGELIGHAQLLMQSDASQQYAFRIEHKGDVIASGRAAVMLQD